MPPKLAPDSNLRARLELAAARMPRRTREIFFACRIDGLSYREIATRTGLSVRRVERHMARAIYLMSEAAEREPGREPTNRNCLSAGGANAGSAGVRQKPVRL